MFLMNLSSEMFLSRALCVFITACVKLNVCHVSKVEEAQNIRRLYVSSSSGFENDILSFDHSYFISKSLKYLVYFMKNAMSVLHCN